MKKIYYIMLAISLILFVLAFTVLANTEWVGGIVIGISIYLFLGTIIKMCKTNDKLKNTLISSIDLLFWLP
ncbi:MAG: hypothetical protein E7157_05630 [Lactobacillales bacterium]|nr:hypothetical protein [Lactobacillales bacterium]